MRGGMVRQRFATCAGVAWTGLFLLPAVAGWKVPFDGSESRPVTYEDVLYLGSFDGAVYAFDVATGEQKWRFQTGEGLASGPEIISAESGRAEDMIGAALEAVANRELPGKREISATPVVRNGVVYIGSKDHHFYALDSRTGNVRWNTQLGAPVFHEATVTEQDVLVHAIGMGKAPEILYVLGTDDGRIKWSTAGQGSATDAARSGDLLCYSIEATKEAASFLLRAAAPSSGEMKWQIELNGGEPSRPFISDDRVFVASHGGGEILHFPDHVTMAPTSTRLYAVELATGKLLWEFQTGEVVAVRTPPLVVGATHVFFVTKDGVHAVRKSSGEKEWTVGGDYSPWNVLLEDKLYVDSGVFKKERISAIDSGTGRVVWTARPGKNLYLEGVGSGRLYASTEGGLVALNTANGDTLWRFGTNPPRSKYLTSVATAPVTVGEQLVFATATNLVWGVGVFKGHLYSIDAKTGALH